MAGEIWAEWAFMPPEEVEVTVDGDDTLALLFMCCHPALTTYSAVALTLRAVGGLTTAEIARAFLVPEATMAQRIGRAKQAIRSSGTPFEMPSPEERGERTAAVLHVLYLIFNEGYTASSGPELHRVDLSAEAIRLTRNVRAVLQEETPETPEKAEVAGLLALMLLTDARRAARTGAHGELIPLTEQDRSLWNRELIAEGVALLKESLPRGPVGPYQLQGAIAAVHDEAARVEETDWAQILALYDLLGQTTDNPMVALNRAVAVAMVYGPVTALELVDALAADPRMERSHRVDAVRAHLWEMAGDRERAATYCRSAAARAMSTPERDYLIARAARLEGTDG